MAGLRVYFLLANLRPDAWVRRLAESPGVLSRTGPQLPVRPDGARQPERDTRCVTERQATGSPKWKSNPNRERHENRSESDGECCHDLPIVACRWHPHLIFLSRDESAEPQPPRRHMAAHPWFSPTEKHFIHASPQPLLCLVVAWPCQRRGSTTSDWTRGPPLVASVFSTSHSLISALFPV